MAIGMALRVAGDVTWRTVCEDPKPIFNHQRSTTRMVPATPGMTTGGLTFVGKRSPRQRPPPNLSVRFDDEKFRMNLGKRTER